MTILVDREIRDYVESHQIGIEPYSREQINPNSYDVRLGEHFIAYHPSGVPGAHVSPIDVADPSTFLSSTISYKLKQYCIYPQTFVLARTNEMITLPPNVVATIEGKSSLARLGLIIHATGGFIDAGFSGSITLEMTNINSRPIILYSGMRIGQLVFRRTAECETPYNMRCGSKYCGQRDATPSKYLIDGSKKEKV